MEHHYLYVEDDPFSREVMRIIMENGIGSGMLTIFEDSTDFLARLNALKTPPTIILLDIHVTPHDGFTMLKLLRAHPSLTPYKVVALTASVMSEEVAQLRQAGFDGAISKPLSIQTFPNLLQRIADGESVWHIS